MSVGERRAGSSSWMAARLLAGLVTVTACGGPTVTPEDGGTPDASSPGVPSPMPPTAVAAPMPPMLGPCPSGWRAIALDDVTTCEPWPEGGAREDCASDEVHLPGTPGCAQLGSPCAADGWPTGLPTDRTIVYVDDDAAAGGDGATRETARTDLAAALAAAPVDAVIAIAAGRYDQPRLEPRRGQTLWGACVLGTQITSSVLDDGAALLLLHETGLGLRNLTLDRPERLAMWVSSGDATIEDVVVRGARSTGLFTNGGITTLRRALFDGTRSAGNGTIGDAIWLRSGTATIDSVVVDGGHEYGLYLSPGASADVHDFVARRVETLVSNDGWGHGIGVEGAHLSLTRAVIEDDIEMGIEVLSGGELALADVVVRRIAPNLHGELGWGIVLSGGSVGTLERVTVEATLDTGLVVGGAGSALDAEDLVVRDTAPRASDSGNGFGISVADGARLGFERVLVARSHEVGLLVAGGSTCTGHDLRVLGVAPSPATSHIGYGVEVQEAATLTVGRIAIEEATGLGAGAIGGGRIDASDLTVIRTRSLDDGTEGRGLGALEGGELIVTRGRIAECFDAGAFVAGATLTLTDVVIEDIAVRPFDSLFGRGVDASEGAVLTLERVRISRVHDDGVFGYGDGTVIHATDLLVADTAAQPGNLHGGIALVSNAGAAVDVHVGRFERSRMAGIAAHGGTVTLDRVVVSGVVRSDCAATTCPSLSGGFGLVSHAAAHVLATDFVVEDAELCGVVVGRDVDGVAGEMDLHRGTITRVAVGACVQIDGYDTERLHDAVEYVDVGVPLQATSYDLPEPGTGLGG